MCYPDRKKADTKRKTNELTEFTWKFATVCAKRGLEVTRSTKDLKEPGSSADRPKYDPTNFTGV